MTPFPTAPARALRSDAQRNRERLLEVAHAAFEEHGVDASLDDVARRAGVGIGTLYRHFPNRDALIESLIWADIERLVALAEELVADDVADGLERWLGAVVRHGITYRGLADSLVAASGAATVLGGLCDRLHGAGAAVVGHAQRRGAVRSDIDPADAVDMTAAIASITERDADDGRRRRLLQIAIDGLRTSS
ncbi:MAG TPA: helix-turn-helix domain-containing protein [Ilumatobacteraceae bacterium]|nr:helix-turn-helix domain-containing protein [Ilumatobacteraceae bacterium]